MTPRIRLEDFSSQEEGLQWQIVNDGVMGGLSRSSFERTRKGTALFQGEVSLENNGGFASVRSLPGSLSLASCSGLRLRVLGDGKTYRLRLRMDDSWDGVTYDAPFATVRGTWIEVVLAFSEFVPRFRGRHVEGAPLLEPSRIRQIGLMITDKQEGFFRIEIDWIEALDLPTD